ncbi:MAG: hypothetical protein ABIF77_11020, partial [bacterium]
MNSASPSSFLVLVLLTLMVLQAPCRALSVVAPCPEPLTPEEWQTDPEAAPDNGFDLRPYLSGQTAAILALGGLAAAIAWNNEDPMAIQERLGRSTFDAIMDIGNAYGGGLVLGGSTLTLLAVGGFTGNDQLTSFASDLCWS